MTIAIAITTWQTTKCARACPKPNVRPLHQYSEIDQEITGKEFAFPKPKIQFGSDETQVGQLPSQTSEVAEVANFIVAGSHKI